LAGPVNALNPINIAYFWKIKKSEINSNINNITTTMPNICSNHIKIVGRKRDIE